MKLSPIPKRTMKGKFLAEANYSRVVLKFGSPLVVKLHLRLRLLTKGSSYVDLANLQFPNRSLSIVAK